MLLKVGAHVRHILIDGILRQDSEVSYFILLLMLLILKLDFTINQFYFNQC